MTKPRPAHMQRQPDKHSVFTCIVCGKQFEEYAYRNPKCCSRKCASTLSSGIPKPNNQKPEIHVTRQCAVCGKDYQTTTHQIRERGSTCCSRECVNQLQSELKRGTGNPNYRGGTILYRGANWGRQSRKAFKRDGCRCQICGKKVGRKRSDYGIHHIKPFREFDGDYIAANQLMNLITLCRSCHSKVEFGQLACPRPLI